MFGYGECLEGFSVGLIDAERLRVIDSPRRWDAWTLLDCIAEDPRSWGDLCLLWPRYSGGSPSVATLGQFPLEEVSRDELVRRLEAAPAWLVIDLQRRWIAAGGRLPSRREPGSVAIAAGAVSALSADVCGAPSHAAGVPWVGLPPWWSVCDQIDVNRLWAPKPAPAERPSALREVLWGGAMLRELARMQVALLHGRVGGPDCQPEDWERLTIEVHRRWLMQPCDALAGRAPRECFTGGHEWIDQITTRQLIRMGRGYPVVPLSTQLSTYADAPFGPLELQSYFHACRSTIRSGWTWLSERLAVGDAERLEERLVANLKRSLEIWLASDRQHRPAVCDLISTERLRVPVLAEFDDPHDSQWGAPCHLVPPGMIGSIMFAPDLTALEVDGEFAFSPLVTWQQWESGGREPGGRESERREPERAVDRAVSQRSAVAG